MQESVPAGSSKPVTLFGHTAMGILDDAIREHLELIRRRGADDSEVRRLEDEAFGPPTRPDEADFPESEEALGSGNGVAVEEAPEDAAAHEDVTTLLPAEQAEEPVVETPGTGFEEPTGAHVSGEVEEPEGEPVLGEPAEEPVAEAPHGEPVAEEHPIVEELEAEVGEAPSEEMDIDLDLTLEDAAAPEELPSEEHPAHEPEGAVPLEPPIESLDTVEHPFPDELTEAEEPHDEAAPSDEHAVEEAEPSEADVDDEEEESSGDGEDVLADTPEFLKDQPEYDELWFEQGEPKDFDF
jgi:hypothetical protein